MIDGLAATQAARVRRAHEAIVASVDLDELRLGVTGATMQAIDVLREDTWRS